MPTPYIEAGDDTFIYQDHWREIAENVQEGGLSLSNGEQSATLVGYIPWNMIRSASRYFLGFARADSGAPWELHREQPHAHPVYPGLRAATFSVQGYVLAADDDNPNNEPFEDSPFDLGESLRNTKYTYAKVSIGYNAWGCRFLVDEDIDEPADEWRRNVVWNKQPSLEVLSADGVSQLVFAEGTGAGGPPPTEPTAGDTRFPAPIGVRLNKATISALWMGVPYDYISSDPDIFSPDKIDACVGHVNDDTVFGKFPAGTLLMLPYSYIDKQFAVLSDDLISPMRCVDITLNFSYFDPPKGVVSAFRGHNLMPFRHSLGKWWYATHNGNTAGNPLLPEADFSELFTHVSS